MSKRNNYNRIHVRVPISGEVFLARAGDAHIRAKAIDISQGGLAVSAPQQSLTEGTYDITITTDGNRPIRLTAQLVRQTESLIGFKTTYIDGESLRLIKDLVYQYQETADFIKQIEEHNLFDHFVDDDGNEIEVTFNVDMELP